MEFLVIVLFVVAIVVVNFVVTRAQRRKGSVSPDAAQAEGAQPDQQRAAKPQKAARKTAGVKAAPAGPRTSAEAAKEANARLDAAQHQQVYAAIAQGHPIGAVKLYAQFTGVGVRAAAAAVENLAMHPQPFQPPRPAGTAASASAGPRPDAPEHGTPTPRNDSIETSRGSTDGHTSDPAGAAGSGPAPSAEKREAGPSAAGSAKAAGGGPDGASGPERSAAPSGPQGGPEGPKPATPEEDEISKWVKNLRPEDF
ncbi:hypothetical protein AAE021_13915 [Arthrobacter citreus]|uniref:Uncharacterized protein n=1 Tax=Arthrobacter citreus TaxID=1670 RepID=A0ABZ2ZYA5_9MICC